MGSRNISAVPVEDKVENIQLHMLTPRNAEKEILRAYEERSSLRGLERTFGISRDTVITWIKKSSRASSIE
jgi:transposase-like protein